MLVDKFAAFVQYPFWYHVSILENRHFPSFWCEGLSKALFKAGDRLDPACYRKLTILPAFEKVFEIIFNNRFEFVNEAFQKIDRLNNGFLKGSRCSDNMFIFQSIVTHQLNLSKPLYVCFVDFSFEIFLS